MSIFDGPIELSDIKIPSPGSPYAQTAFQPYDPILQNNNSDNTNSTEALHIPQSSASGVALLHNNNTNVDLEYNNANQHSSKSSSSNSLLQPRHQRILLLLIVASSGALLHLVHNYETLKLEYGPLLVLVLVGLLSSGVAQLVNQFYKRLWHWLSILRFIVWGSINGVLTSLWIDMLIVQFPNIIVRVLVDQLVGSPCFQLIFLALAAIWDNSDIKTVLRVNYLRSLKLSYLIWPSFSILSFSILPPELIFPCNCLVNLIWNVILSFIL